MKSGSGGVMHDEINCRSAIREREEDGENNKRKQLSGRMEFDFG